MLKTPFGNIEIYFDNALQKKIKIEKGKQNHELYPEVAAVFLLRYFYQADQKAHTLKCVLDTEQKGVIESGEHLDAISFYYNGGKMTIGCNSDFGVPAEGNFDFNGTYLDNGLVICMDSITKSQSFVFAVSWLQKCTDKNDIQTWFASAPTLHKQ